MDEARNLIKGIGSNNAVTFFGWALQRVSGTLVDLHANVRVVQVHESLCALCRWNTGIVRTEHGVRIARRLEKSRGSVIA